MHDLVQKRTHAGMYGARGGERHAARCMYIGATITVLWAMVAMKSPITVTSHR